VVGLAVVLSLRAWAFSGLFPRAWNAGQALLGVAESPIDPVKNLNRDPDLAFPDFAPARLSSSGAISRFSTRWRKPFTDWPKPKRGCAYPVLSIGWVRGRLPSDSQKIVSDARSKRDGT
jgi:hypothetical protein